MKRSNYINIMAALAVGLTAGGCADDTFDPVRGYDTDREVKLNLRLPAFAAASTRAVDENALQDIKIYFMQGDAVESDETLSTADGNLELGEGANKNIATATVLVPAGTTSIRLVGNYTAAGLIDETDENVMTFDPNSKSALVFYGESSVQNLESGNGNIDLYRSCAKTTFALDEELTDFEVLSYALYGNPDKGMVAYTSTDATAPNLPTGIAYAETPVTVSATAMAASPYYHYEAAAGECCWIIKGKYNGQDGYYKVAYIKDDDNLDDHTTDNNADELALLRNHHYEFVIQGVNAPGYATAAAALAAPAENRLRVVLKDHAENIFDIIACADYYLGVKDEVTATAENTYYEFDIISSYKYKDGLPTATLVETADWISNIKVGVSKNTTAAPTDGTLYTVSCTLTKNTTSSDSRTAKILIRVGDLSREVRLTQEGADFMYGPLAPYVSLLQPSDGATGHCDYFGFLKETLNGETEDEMGVSRGDGLHFQVYAESGKQFSYKIAKIPNVTISTLKATDPDLVTVTETDEGWDVELTDAGNENYKIWTSSLVMTAGEVTITYQVYHTGIIHYLDGTGQMDDPSGQTVKGWFYYEQVDVTGDDGQTYHILDRNIGASSNVAYSPGSTFLSNATEARGAYLKVPGQQKMAELEAKLPAGFNTLPGMYHLANMGFKLFNASEGSMGWDTQSNSLLPRIYLPVAGSMDGTSHVDEFRAEIWSNTMVQGNQGFFPGDAEYGYWYRILNVYGAEINITTQRIASRSTGASRGIPVRAMACPPAEPGWELPTIATGRSRIILMNDDGWTSATITCGGIGSDKYEAKMVAGDDEKTWFYTDIKGIPTDVTFSSGSYKTETFKVNLVNAQAIFSNVGVGYPKPITIYMRDDNNWGNAYIHYWVGEYNFTEWNKLPQMKLDASAGVSGEKWYKYVIDGAAENLLFNSTKGDNGTTSGNIDGIQSKLDSSRILRFKNGGSDKFLGTGVPSGSGGSVTPSGVTYRFTWPKDSKQYIVFSKDNSDQVHKNMGEYEGLYYYDLVLDNETVNIWYTVCQDENGNNKYHSNNWPDVQSKRGNKQSGESFDYLIKIY